MLPRLLRAVGLWSVDGIVFLLLSIDLLDIKGTRPQSCMCFHGWLYRFTRVHRFSWLWLFGIVPIDGGFLGILSGPFYYMIPAAPPVPYRWGHVSSLEVEIYGNPGMEMCEQALSSARRKTDVRLPSLQRCPN